MSRFSKGALFASVSALVVMPGVSLAQDDDRDRIVVTATKREQAIQDVPFSINAQTQEDIQKTGSQNLEDLSRNVAGLIIQNLGPGQSQVAIRGVSAGQIIRDQPGVKEQVGVYLDESVISLSLFTPDLDLFDLNRVETLRGPQGTLFGSGSIGGTIRYITNQPKVGEFEGMVEGNFNVIDGGGVGGHGKGVVNFPIGETAALRIVGGYTEYGGYIDALKEGETGEDNDVNNGHRLGGRVALRWEVTPDIVITPRVIYQDIETNGFNRQEAFNLFANPFTTTRAPIQLGERQQYLLLDEAFEDEILIADGTIEIGLGPVDFTSVTSYTDRDILVSRDASALTGSVSVDLGYPDSAVLIPSNLRDTTAVEQFTQEARLASNGDGPFNWLIGIFYSDTERLYSQRLPTPGYDAVTDMVLGAGTSAMVANGFGPDSPYNADLPYDLEQFAVFTEATLDITDRLHATGGVRYYDFSEDRTFTSGGLFSNGDNQADTTKSDGFAPRFLLSYDVSDTMTLNAQASKGFRLGGANDPLNITLCSMDDAATFGGFPTYDDESLWNYEVGAKVNSGNVRFNAAAFYTDISNLQVTADAGSCSSRVVFNVPEAHTLGLEAELGAELTDGFDVSIAGSWVQAEFDSTVTDVNSNVLAGIREGNRLASVPEFQIAATASYTFPLNWGGQSDGFVAVSAQHVGSRFTQPSDQEPGAGNFASGLAFGGASGMDVTMLDLELDSYQLVNLQAGIDWETVSIFLYANNLFDENANLSFDRERGGRARLGFRTNQPRTFGLTVRKSF